MTKQIVQQKKAYLHLPFFVEQDEDGVWVAESAIFEGCVTQGHTPQELQDNVEDVSQLYFDLLQAGEVVLKGKNLVYFGFDKDAHITNHFSTETYTHLTEKMISLAQK